MNNKFQLLVSALFVLLISLQAYSTFQSRPSISAPPLKNISNHIDNHLQSAPDSLQISEKAISLKKSLLEKNIEGWKISTMEFSMIDQGQIIPLNRDCPFSLISERGMSEIKYCNSTGNTHLYLEVQTAAFPDSFIIKIAPVDNSFASIQNILIWTLSLALTLFFINLILLILKTRKPEMDKMKEFWESFEKILEKDNLTPETIAKLPSEASEQRFWKTSLLTQVNHMDNLINESIRYCPPHSLLNRQSKIELLSWDSLEVNQVSATMLGFFGPSFGHSFWNNFNAADEERLKTILEQKEILITKASENSLMLFQSKHSLEIIIETLASLLSFKEIQKAGFPVIITDDFQLQTKSVHDQKFWTIRSDKLDFFTHGHFNRIQLNSNEIIIDDQLADHLTSIGSIKKKDQRRINDKNLFRIDLERVLSLDLKKINHVLK